MAGFLSVLGIGIMRAVPGSGNQPNGACGVDAQANAMNAGAAARRRLLQWLWKLPLLFVLVTVSQVLLLRFVDPPFSSFMAIRQLQAFAHGDWSFRVAHDWRDLSRISPNLPLALVAAEDQNFARHHGFGFRRDRQGARTTRMVQRAEQRGRPVRRLRGASTISQQVAKNLFLWAGNGPTRWLRRGWRPGTRC